MRTKIHWARKSQQPPDTVWTFAREIGPLPVGDCTTDKKIILLLQIELLLTLN